MSISGDPQKGSDTHIIAKLQSSQRTTVTPDRHLGKIEEETDHPDPEVNWNEEYLIGTGREMHSKSEGQYVYEGGSYPIIPYDGYPIALLFGSESFSSDTPTSGTNEHTLTVKGASGGGGLPPSVTVEAAHFGRGGASDFVRTFNTVVPQSGEISVDNEGRLEVTLDTIALGVSKGTSATSTPTMPDRDPFLFSDISSDFSFGGTSVVRFEEFTYTLNQNSGARHYIESTRAPDPYEILYGGQANHELTATVTVVDDTFYDELNSPTDGGITITFAFEKASGDRLDFSFDASNLSTADHATPRGESEEDDTLQVEMDVIPESVTCTVDDTGSSAGYLA